MQRMSGIATLTKVLFSVITVVEHHGEVKCVLAERSLSLNDPNLDDHLFV